MDDRLYLVRANKYVEADPVRGREKSDIEYSSYHLATAKSVNVASQKLLAHLNKGVRPGNWQNTEVKELYAGADIPLEKRVQILREVVPLIE